MMHELAILCASDIVRLLGALVLLSLGITLTLWGLKRRQSGAVVIALFLCLAALVPTVLAVEIPPTGSVAYIQTSGPNTALTIGDWYTSLNPDAGGPGYHTFDIYIPCTLDPAQVITVDLFDPESNDTAASDLDETRGGDDDTTFTLLAPDGITIVDTNIYLPGGGTSQTWVTFTTFTRGAYGCGIYQLTTTTSDDDDNAWRLRVEPDNLDGVDGTGDEISLGNLQTTFQNLDYACQMFHFFVPVTSSVRLNNFDLDVPGVCDPLLCTVVYTTPSGATIPGIASGNAVWNNGGAGYPPPGGDVIPDPEPGWWQAALCMNNRNQYLFDAGGVYFYEKPATPDMTVSKDDGTDTFHPDGVLTYTITYANAGPGAALDAMLTDTLPLSVTFVSCDGGLSCGYIPPPPDSGIVTFSLGTIISGASGSVRVSVRVDPGAPTGTMTNTVELDYTDIVFSDYPVETDDDVDRYEALPPTPTPTSTTEPPTPTSTTEPRTPTSTTEPPGAEPPGAEPPGPPTSTSTPTSIFVPISPTLTPTPVSPAPGAPTLTVAILTVETLPETGGFPEWFTVVLGVPIVIGAVGLLSLALSEVKGRRGGRKGT